MVGTSITATSDLTDTRLKVVLCASLPCCNQHKEGHSLVYRSENTIILIKKLNYYSRQASHLSLPIMSTFVSPYYIVINAIQGLPVFSSCDQLSMNQNKLELSQILIVLVVRRCSRVLNTPPLISTNL